MSNLITTGLTRMLEGGMLPSGGTFVLKPDTVETSLAVAEFNAASKWQIKTGQVMHVTESVNGDSVAESGGASFISQMPDTDVVFLGLAWSCQLQDGILALDEAIPCPQCSAPITQIDLSDLKIKRWESPVEGDDAYFEVTLPDRLKTKLPKSLNGLFVRPPTWQSARSKIGDDKWENGEVRTMRRTMAALATRSTDGSGFRFVTEAEAKKMPTMVIKHAALEMDRSLPHVQPVVPFVCKACGFKTDAPFDQAL